MEIKCWFASDPGTRGNNEDNFAIPGKRLRILPNKTVSGKKVIKSEKPIVFMCADGMGGGANGEKCSLTAIKTARKLQSETRPDELAEIINNKITRYGKKLNTFCGSTFVSVEFRSDGKSIICYISAIGDSPVYRFSDGIITRLTQDNNYYGELLTDGQAPDDPKEIRDCKRQITKYFGMSGKPEMQNYRLICEAGDVFVLSSDGASSMIDETDFDLSGILKQSNPARSAVESCVEYNKNASGKSDNTTVIIMEVT